MASRATQNAAMDAALLTIAANLPTWIANGGKDSTFFRWVNAQLAATHPSMARLIERKLGNSYLSGFPSTITAADVAP